MTTSCNSDYTLDRRSTPLSEFKCPKAARDIGEHTVTKGEGISYSCTCGCTFEWESDLPYRVLPEQG
jgi:hypothetical protein